MCEEVRDRLLIFRAGAYQRRTRLKLEVDMFGGDSGDIKVRALLGGALEGRLPPVEFARVCKMCGDIANYFFSVDFSKNSCGVPAKQYGIAVNHYRCVKCDHIFTDFCDDWSHEDFSQNIYNDSYHVYDPEYDGTRSKFIASIISEIAGDIIPSLSMLDFGSGQGVFEQEMRRFGVRDIASYDPYAGGQIPDRKFDVVSAYEVIEHSPDPKGTINLMSSMVSEGGVMFFSQEYIPDNILELRHNWKYLGPRNGRISFFSMETVHVFCQKNDFQYRICDWGFFIWRGELSSLVKRYVDSFQVVAVPLVLDHLPLMQQANGWHALEETEGRYFRWSGKEKAPLGLHELPAARTRISFPVMMAISDELWEGVHLQVGEKLFPLARVEDRLEGWIEREAPGRECMWLITRPPLRPCDVGMGGDARPLGLAVFVGADADWTAG